MILKSLLTKVVFFVVYCIIASGNVFYGRVLNGINFKIEKESLFFQLKIFALFS